MGYESYTEYMFVETDGGAHRLAQRVNELSLEGWDMRGTPENPTRMLWRVWLERWIENAETKNDPRVVPAA